MDFNKGIPSFSQCSIASIEYMRLKNMVTKAIGAELEFRGIRWIEISVVDPQRVQLGHVVASRLLFPNSRVKG